MRLRVVLLLVVACSSLASALSRPGLPRRAVLSGAAACGAAAIVAPAAPVFVAAAPLKDYKDARYGVSMGIPDGWTATQNELPDGRRIVTAADPNDIDTNVFLTFTPIRPDYSSLGSFGTIDFVANTILPQCGDISYACSFSKGDGIEGKMVSQAVLKGNYFYDYTIEQKGGPLRHLKSIVGIKADGGSSLLVGLGAQCLESKYGAESATLKAVIDSFKI